MKVQPCFTSGRIDWRGTVAVMIVWSLLCCGAIHWQALEKREAEAEAQTAATAARRSAPPQCRGPAPKLRKGKPVIIKGHKMSSWVASGAGDNRANGVYVEVGPDQYSNGQCYLQRSGSYWVIECEGPLYQGSGALPANPWSLGYGSAPAPTLGVHMLQPWPWMYDLYVWTDAPFIPCPSTCAPARATIDDNEHLCLPMHDATNGRYGVITYAPAADTWGWAPAAGALHSVWDAYHTAGAWDGGDGTIHVASGAYLDGAAWKLDVATVAVTPGVSTVPSACDCLALAGGDLSNLCQVGPADFLCVLVDGSAVKLCSYGVGDGSLKVERHWAAAPPLPPGHVPVQLDSAERHDHYLYREPQGGALYWLRHCEAPGGDRRLVAYQIAGTSTIAPPPLYGNQQWALVGNQLIGESLVLLGDVITAGTVPDCCQTWGAYAYPAGTLVADVGTESWHAATVRWQPGQGGRPAAPFVSHPAGRRWYLDGDPLLLAGWTNDTFSYLPFVVKAAPGGLAVQRALQEAVAAELRLTERLQAEGAGLGLTAAELTLRRKDLLAVETAALYAAAHDLGVIGSPVRARAASTSEWEYVRVRAGA